MARQAATAKTPTCAIRTERSPRGFTLLELVVALAIAVLAVMLVPPALDRLRDGVRYRDTVRQVVTELRAARQQARIEGVDARFFVDLASRRFGLDERALHSLPTPLRMQITVAGIEWQPAQRGAIRFLPQGGATGGSIDVLRPDGSGVRITVDWLSAALTQSAITP